MTKKTKNKISVRLASHVAPVSYKITLEPDLEAHTFKGEEVITIKLARSVREITLHSASLAIMSAEILSGTERISAQKISYDEKSETATFHFAKMLGKGRHKLALAFEGVLADNMRGFYKSKYVVDGKERFMATTQFEATDARRCIPCFDEPAQKAVFHVSLIIPPDKTAISNTLPTDIREHESGNKIISFAPTPKMSTYLLAFIVGDFEYLEKKTKSGVIVRVHTTPGKKSQAKFSLECAVRTLEFYERYFAIRYPLNTLDMIAIPDFASGAMENWGAVTYRESALLVDEANSSSANKQWVALVVAHELAHQWFGNLVTMEWWTHLWLNEGFASYIEYLAVDHLFPDWNIWSQFLANDHGPALRLDALGNTHPIEVDVHHPDEIGEIFDEVSYSKGASVIRMLAGYLGETDFRDGLRHYLKKHSYKNTETIHLWQSFEKVSGKPVKKMIENWTKRGGYPLVSIESSGKTFTLSQKRFFASQISEKKLRDTTRWLVPISWRGDRKKTGGMLLSKARDVMHAPSDAWLKWNPGETGLYRIAYDEKILAALAKPVAENRLPALDRTGIIRDLFALAEAGIHSATTGLAMARSYANETDYVVWIETLSGLGRVNHVFGDTAFAAQLKAYSLGIVASAAKTIGWERRTNERHEDALLRSALLFVAGHYGDARTIQTAKKLFKNRAKTSIHPDLRGLVYSLVAENGGATEYRALVAMYRSAELHEEKNRIGRALTYFTDAPLLRATLDFALSSAVRPQDAPSIIAGVLGNTHGTDVGWAFMKKNWKELHRRYSSGGHMLPRLIAPLAAFTDRSKALEIKKFFRSHPAPGAARTLLQVEEKILINDAWKKRDGKKIGKWLTCVAR